MGRMSLMLAAAADDGGSSKVKSSWPEVVGKFIIGAVAKIKVDRPNVIIKLLLADDAQPPDFDAHRVCVFLDGDAIVVRTPVVG